MSRENLELVRTVYEGWARGDFRAGADLFAPDFEWKQRPDAVEPGSHRGPAIGTALRRILEVWEDYRLEAEEYIDATDAVVVVSRARGTARGSGIPLDQRMVVVWRARDGKLVGIEAFGTREEALEAVGLPE